MTKVVFPGSFDPLTKGHLDMIERASHMFDEVVIAILINAEKKSMLSLEQRMDIIQHEIKGYHNVSCVSSDGLSVDLAKKIGAQAMLRGVRSVMDFEYEMKMAQANRFLNAELDTILMYTDPAYAFISSSIIREMLAYGQSVDELVGTYTATILKSWIQQ